MAFSFGSTTASPSAPVFGQPSQASAGFGNFGAPGHATYLLLVCKTYAHTPHSHGKICQLQVPQHLLALEHSLQPAMRLDRPLLRKLLDNQLAHNPQVVLALASHNQQQALALDLVKPRHQVAVGLVSHKHQLYEALVSHKHQLLEDSDSHNQQQAVALASHHQQQAVALVSRSQQQAVVLASIQHQQVPALVLGHLSPVPQCLVRLSLLVLQHRQHQLLG